MGLPPRQRTTRNPYLLDSAMRIWFGEPDTSDAMPKISISSILVPTCRRYAAAGTGNNIPISKYSPSV
jgi:hypothetical protein